MLEVCTLECVRGERRLFADLEFRLGSGELLSLQGENGSGKTSLLRILCGLLSPTVGEVFWRGQATRVLGEEYRRELCYIGHYNAIKEELTPLENLRASSRLAEEFLPQDAALEALGKLGLGGREELACRYLSQGQKRRVALARLVHERRALWILDEPYVGLDAGATRVVSGLLAAHLQRGGVAVLTTHQTVELAAGQVRELCLS